MTWMTPLVAKTSNVITVAVAALEVTVTIWGSLNTEISSPPAVLTGVVPWGMSLD